MSSTFIPAEGERERKKERKLVCVREREGGRDWK